MLPKSEASGRLLAKGMADCILVSRFIGAVRFNQLPVPFKFMEGAIIFVVLFATLVVVLCVISVHRSLKSGPSRRSFDDGGASNLPGVIGGSDSSDSSSHHGTHHSSSHHHLCHSSHHGDLERQAGTVEVLTPVEAMGGGGHN